MIVKFLSSPEGAPPPTQLQFSPSAQTKFVICDCTIEWCFRRWKSLCRLSVLPVYPAKIAEPVLLAKLIIILLMQQRLGYLPWRDWWTDLEPAPVISPIVQMTYLRVCEIIRPVAVIDQLLTDPKPFLRHLRSSRRKRPLQLAEATRRFAGLVAGLSHGPAG